MKLPTPAEMAALERGAQDQFGISVASLMDRAGACAAEAGRRLLRPRGGRRVVVAAGKGNNGGDGFVAARELADEAVVTVILAAPEEEIQGEAALRLRGLRERNVPVVAAASFDDVSLARALGDADLLMDAIFGTGFRGPATGEPARVIDAINRSGVPVLAVDVPSGIDARTGHADPPCVRAAATVTMGLPKVGLMQYPAAACSGTVFVADIGFPAALVENAPIATELAVAAWVDRTLRRRPPDSHKGQSGRVAVIAGARGFIGAAVLASRGALRTGAGLVTVGLPGSFVAVPAGSLPEAMTRALPETPEGTISERALEAVLDLAGDASAVAIGPGLTTHPEVASLVRALLPRLEHPAVLDADALNVLAGMPELLRDAPGPFVITPHPGEMARLLGRGISDVQRDRVETARSTAVSLGVTVVLKGARTVVAEPGGHVRIVPTGNAAMATAGMGDVLTGAITALLAEGVAPFEAATCGAYLHGCAGDLAACGDRGLLAHEVADAIPRALARVRTGDVDDGVRTVP
ncbi:MAG TPA: NAD(P)H-hydrate dehydratase [bacterium]|nr:NAD(P)H-hydrate dehydratase [bacterium]